jgi:hypothetical protein
LPAGVGLPQNQVYFDSTAKLFYPFFNFQFRSNLHGPFFFDSLLTSHQKTSLSDPSVGSLTIMGVNLPLYFFDTTLSPHYTASGISASFTLDPLEYWPFANRLGQPVFDTSTGAQINDPFL